MTSAETITTYKAILETTGKMLSAAKNNQWDDLVILEKECRGLTDKLMNGNPEPILDEDLLQSKIKMIHQILGDDAQIKAITQPWMEKLQHMINTVDLSRKLEQTYQSFENI